MLGGSHETATYTIFNYWVNRLQQQSDLAADISSAQLLGNAAAKGPKLYIFDCGRIRLVSVEAFNLKETDTDVRELSAPCYVVDHPMVSCYGMRVFPGVCPDSMVR